MDIKQQCFRSGAQYFQPGKVTIEYLNQSYVIAIPNMEISLKDSLNHCEGQNPVSTLEGQESSEDIHLKDRILILHYLITAKGTPNTGKLIGFRQVPGGLFEHARRLRLIWEGPKWAMVMLP